MHKLTLLATTVVLALLLPLTSAPADGLKRDPHSRERATEGAPGGCCGGHGDASDNADYSFELVEFAGSDSYTLETLTEELPLVLHFWGYKCPHCRSQMPYLMQFYGGLDLDAVTFAAVCVNGSAEEIADYIAEYGLDFLILDGTDGGWGDGYRANGWPTTYVFTPGGELVGYSTAKGPGYSDEMDGLLAEAGAGTE
jgi:thiol-disulfide isomerase/thioredoxin